MFVASAYYPLSALSLGAASLLLFGIALGMFLVEARTDYSRGMTAVEEVLDRLELFVVASDCASPALLRSSPSSVGNS
jgi:hypothetical protein